MYRTELIRIFSNTFLLNWRTHWILVLLKWFVSFVLGIRPVLIEHGFELIKEHRMCGIKTNKRTIAPYSIGLVYVLPKSIAIIVYAAFLTLAFLYRHRCFNFPTLLACNTALAVLINSANHIATAVYMFIWDQYLVPDMDSLCALRAYLQHSTVTCIYHSFILLAIEKYNKVIGIRFLNTKHRKICLVLFQWIFDFTFDLPVLVTGNMTKLSFDNVCFVKLTRLDLSLYMAGVSFLLTDIVLSIIYRLLVRHVRQVSARLDNNRQMRMQRDLTMVRRIILLNLQLIIVGIPVLIVVVFSIVRVDLVPNKFMRVILLMTILPYSPLLIILLLLTPNLQEILKEWRNKFKFRMTTGITPIQIVA
ncbi:hypothetical protein I4U23_023143 [Adineta vaga]|nr:hypothetical protein I4U23_023143 [Adineta vaga]